MGMQSMFVKEVTEIGNALGLEGEFLKEFGFSQIMEKIKPTPPPQEFEEVEVKRFLLVNKTTGLAEAWAGLGDEPYDSSVHDVVKLTGTMRRPIPQKVERSVSGEVEWGHQDGLCIPFTVSAPLVPFRELIGKRGLLTFTWTE